MWILTAVDVFQQPNKTTYEPNVEQRVLLPGRHYTLGRIKEGKLRNKERVEAHVQNPELWRPLSANNTAISGWEADLLVGRAPGDTATLDAARLLPAGDAAPAQDKELLKAVPRDEDTPLSLPPDWGFSTVQRTRHLRGLGLHRADAQSNDPADAQASATVSRVRTATVEPASTDRRSASVDEENEFEADASGQPPSASAAGANGPPLPTFPQLLQRASDAAPAPDAPRLVWVKRTESKWHVVHRAGDMDEISCSIRNNFAQTNAWHEAADMSEEAKQKRFEVKIHSGDIVRTGKGQAIHFRYEPMVFGFHAKAPDAALKALEARALRYGLRVKELHKRHSVWSVTHYVTPSLNAYLRSQEWGANLPGAFKQALYCSIPVVAANYVRACMRTLRNFDVDPNKAWSGWPAHEDFAPTAPNPGVLPALAQPAQEYGAAVPHALVDDGDGGDDGGAGGALETPTQDVEDAQDELTDKAVRVVAQLVGLWPLPSNQTQQQRIAAEADQDIVSGRQDLAQLRKEVRQTFFRLCTGQTNGERLKGLTLLYLSTSENVEEAIQRDLTFLRQMGAVVHVHLLPRNFTRVQVEAVLAQITPAAAARYREHAPPAGANGETAKPWIPANNGLLLALGPMEQQERRSALALAADARIRLALAPNMRTNKLSVLPYTAGVLQTVAPLGFEAQDFLKDLNEAPTVGPATISPARDSAAPRAAATAADGQPANRAAPAKQADAPAAEGTAPAAEVTQAPVSLVKPVLKRRLLKQGTGASTAAAPTITATAEPAASLSGPPSNQLADGPAAAQAEPAALAPPPARAGTGARRRLVTGAAARQPAQADQANAGASSGSVSQLPDDLNSVPRSCKYRLQLEAESRGESIEVDPPEDGSSCDDAGAKEQAPTQRSEEESPSAPPAPHKTTVVTAALRRDLLKRKQQEREANGEAEQDEEAPFSTCLEAARKEAAQEVTAFEGEIVTGVTKGGNASKSSPQKSRATKKTQKQHDEDKGADGEIDELEIDLRAWRALDPEVLKNEAKENWLQVTQVPLFRTDRPRSQAPPTQDASSGPNFKKFRRAHTQEPVRSKPVLLELQEANDYGLGEAYYGRSATDGDADFDVGGDAATQGRGAAATQRQKRKGRLVLDESESDDDADVAPAPTGRRGKTQTAAAAPTAAGRKRQRLEIVSDEEEDDAAPATKSARVWRQGTVTNASRTTATLLGQSSTETMESAASTLSRGPTGRRAAAAKALNAIDSDSDGDTFKFSSSKSKAAGSSSSAAKGRAGRR